MKIIIKAIPLIQLIATCIISFIDLDGYAFVYLGNLLGYSLLSSIFYFFATNDIFIKKISISLFLISSYNLISTYVDYKIYDRLFLSIILLSLYICLILKKH